MTAAEFLPLVGGRSTGRDTGMGHCPAHEDKNRSLSVRQGKDRILVHCFSGCSVTAILKALDLRLRDLFSGTPLTAEQRAAADKARKVAEVRTETQRCAERDAFDTERLAGELVMRIAEALSILPDDDPQQQALTALYHEALDLFRRCETESESVLRMRRSNANTTPNHSLKDVHEWQPA